jgi:hypothetical protein
LARGFGVTDVKPLLKADKANGASMHTASGLEAGLLAQSSGTAAVSGALPARRGRAAAGGPHPFATSPLRHLLFAIRETVAADNNPEPGRQYLRDTYSPAVYWQQRERFMALLEWLAALGNAVLWKGDWKLVRNLPPYGDGRWALYNIVADPGETRDLAAAEPARFRAMQADYAAYAARDRVLAMPPGYTSMKQVEENGKRDRLYPQLRALGAWVAGGIGLVIGGVVAFRRRRRQRG